MLPVACARFSVECSWGFGLLETIGKYALIDSFDCAQVAGAKGVGDVGDVDRPVAAVLVQSADAAGCGGAVDGGRWIGCLCTGRVVEAESIFK